MTGNYIIDGDTGMDCRSPKHMGCSNCEPEECKYCGEEPCGCQETFCEPLDLGDK